MRKYNVGDQILTWTILEINSPKSKVGRSYVVAQCNCGIKKECRTDGLKNCSKCSPTERSSYWHGKTHSRIFRVWSGMVSRCNNPKSKRYYLYGGRGIKVCERWRDFRLFYEDMGDAPLNHQIDRTDPDGDYSPENCRWVTAAENMNNRRMSKSNRSNYIWVSKDDVCKDCFEGNVCE